MPSNGGTNSFKQELNNYRPLVIERPNISLRRRSLASFVWSVALWNTCMEYGALDADEGSGVEIKYGRI